MTAALTIAALLIFAGPRSLNAHEIPTSVIVRIIVKQDSSRVRVLVRAPLEAIRDIDFPLRAGSNYIDLRRADSLLPQAATTWILDPIHVFQNGTELRGTIATTRTSLTSDRAFASDGTAERQLVAPPLDPKLDVETRGLQLDVAIDYPITSPGADFTITPSLARLGVRTTTVITIIGVDGTERMLEYQGDAGVVSLDPRWYTAAWQFVQLGFSHILDGIDHLLFIICLVLPFRKLKPLIGIVTAFTVAHSLTLIASTLGWAPDALWFPPLVEVLIALSIVFMALENIVTAARDGTPRVQRRWLMAFGFGLIHGFGFSFALRESLQFAGRHLALSLVSFNIGVEIGQVFVLCLALPVLAFAWRHIVSERVGTIIVSAFVTHTAWHWLVDRWTALRQYQVEWTLAAMLPIIRIIMASAIIIGLVMIGSRIFRVNGSRIRGDAV